MLLNIFLVFCIVSLLALPVFFWMFLFVSFFDAGLSRKQFLSGVLIGGGITVSFVFSPDFFFGTLLDRIFLEISHFSFLSSFGIIFPSFLFLGILFFLINILGSSYFQRDKKLQIRYFLLSILAYVGVSILGYVLLTVGYIIFGNTPLSASIAASSVFYTSFGALILYYLCISLFEESSKYSGLLNFSGGGNFAVFPSYIAASASIALGFAFFENIWYTYSSFLVSGLSGSLVSLVFFRSLFSVVLHITASLFFSLAFWRFFQGYEQKNSRYFFLFSFYIGLSLLSHTFFNIALTFGYAGALFAYIIVLYVLLSLLLPSETRSLETPLDPRSST